jgi:hypothetical protein
MCMKDMRIGADPALISYSETKSSVPVAQAGCPAGILSQSSNLLFKSDSVYEVEWNTFILNHHIVIAYLSTHASLRI